MTTSMQSSRALVELMATLPSLRVPSTAQSAQNDYAKSVQEAEARGEAPQDVTRFIFDRLAAQLELAQVASPHTPVASPLATTHVDARHKPF